MADFIINPGDVPEVETVDQRTGQRVIVKAFTSDELKQALREAPRASGREPLFLGIRNGGRSPDEVRAHLNKVHASTVGETGSRLIISGETFNKTA